MTSLRVEIIRNVFKVGGSHAVALPQAHRDFLKIYEHDPLRLGVIEAAALFAMHDGKPEPLFPKAKPDEWVQIVRRD